MADVAAIPVGPELDAAIAREVFGITVVGIVPCSREPECGELEVSPHWGDTVERPVAHLGECACSELAEEGDDITLGHLALLLNPVPSYSSDIAAAWQVVEKLRSQRIDVMVYQGERDIIPEDLKDENDRRWECALWWSVDGDHRETTQYGDTAPEAICRAALSWSRSIGRE